MISVKIFGHGPARVLDIVQELRASGLVQGQDFDFAYHSEKYNSDGWEAVQQRYAEFTFYTEQYATMFSLRYT